MTIQLVDWPDGATIGTLQHQFGICHPDLDILVEIDGKCHKLTGIKQWRPLDNKNVVLSFTVEPEGKKFEEWKMIRSSSAVPTVPAAVA
jgi:hypothetical protein